jgi:hypothetical protein
MTDLHPVNVGACRCPGAPHADGDVVSLANELSTPAGIAAQAALSQGGSWEDLYAGMLMGLMRHSVREWTLRDDDGPIPVTPVNVEKHLPWLKGGREVAGKAAELYANILLAPFVEASKKKVNARKTRTKSSSPNGSTATSST